MASRSVSRILRGGALGSIALSALHLPVMADPASTGQSADTVEAKIARALSAGPPDITQDATVAEMGPHGAMTVLRKGSNDWTCVPGNLDGVGMPPMCEDSVAVQWNRDRDEGKPGPTTKVPDRIHARGRHPAKRLRPVRQDRPADQDRATLDDPVAVRSEDLGIAHRAQSDGSLHHVRGHTLGSCPCDGCAVTRGEASMYRDPPGRRYPCPPTCVPSRQNS